MHCKGINYDTGITSFGNNPALLVNLSLSPEELEPRFNAFLGRASTAVRDHFLGPVTYASGTWETIDWSLFDLVGVDHYRDASNRSSYREQLRPYFHHERPVVVTEVGCPVLFSLAHEHYRR